MSHSRSSPVSILPSSSSPSLPPFSSPLHFSLSEWISTTNNVSLPSSSINSLILDYCQMSGFEAVANAFSLESNMNNMIPSSSSSSSTSSSPSPSPAPSLSPSSSSVSSSLSYSSPLSSLPLREKIRHNILKSEFSIALDHLVSISPLLLPSYPYIHFTLLLHQLVEHIKNKNTRGAVKYIKDKIIPFIENNEREYDNNRKNIVKGNVSEDQNVHMINGNDKNNGIINGKDKENGNGKTNGNDNNHANHQDISMDTNRFPPLSTYLTDMEHAFSLIAFPSPSSSPYYLQFVSPNSLITLSNNINCAIVEFQQRRELYSSSLSPLLSSPHRPLNRLNGNLLEFYLNKFDVKQKEMKEKFGYEFPLISDNYIIGGGKGEEEGKGEGEILMDWEGKRREKEKEITENGKGKGNGKAKEGEMKEKENDKDVEMFIA